VWSTDGSEGDAWLVVRDASESIRSIVVEGAYEGDASNASAEGRVRLVEADQARSPIVYALLAWGLGPLTRLFRQRSDIGVAALAARCNVDPSQLSRLEAGDPRANVQIEAFTRVATDLGIPLPQLIDHSAWVAQRGDLACSTSPDADVDAKAAFPVLPPPSGLPHFLHPYQLALPEGWRGAVRPAPHAAATPPLLSSWIVLDGDARIHLEGDRREFVETGDVVHFRQTMPIRVDALSEFRALQIVYSTSCACDVTKRAPADTWVVPRPWHDPT
jgi:transcriptional regulator with XRE-family HTH domain